MTSSARVRVTEHSFGLFDHYEIPIHTADWSTGLIVEMSSGAMIYTGISHGIVNVTVDLRDTPPDAIDTADWEDIAEVSVHAPHGDLKVHLLQYGASQPPPRLPLLSTRGPGTYRLRAHARGRDAHFDQAHDESGEDYLLTIWPAEALPSLIIRATDWCGYGLRLGQLHSTGPTNPPKAAPEPDTPSGDARAVELRQAILDLRSRFADPPQPDESP